MSFFQPQICSAHAFMPGVSFCKMSIINYSVYCNSKRRSILPWQISSINPPSLTFRNFFLAEVRPRCEDNCEISDVFVGKSKDSLDRVNIELVIADVISIFGPFVKYTVGQVHDEVVSIPSFLSVIILKPAMHIS